MKIAIGINNRIIKKNKDKKISFISHKSFSEVDEEKKKKKKTKAEKRRIRKRYQKCQTKN